MKMAELCESKKRQIFKTNPVDCKFSKVLLLEMLIQYLFTNYHCTYKISKRNSLSTVKKQYIRDVIYRRFLVL